MSFTLEDLKTVSNLARLDLSDEELAQMVGNLNKVLESFRGLQQLDLSGIEITAHSVDTHSVWREDEPRNGLSRAEALSSAPASHAGLFLVPRIIE